MAWNSYLTITRVSDLMRFKALAVRVYTLYSKTASRAVSSSHGKVASEGTLSARLAGGYPAERNSS